MLMSRRHACIGSYNPRVSNTEGYSDFNSKFNDQTTCMHFNHIGEEFIPILTCSDNTTSIPYRLSCIKGNSLIINAYQWGYISIPYMI